MLDRGLLSGSGLWFLGPLERERAAGSLVCREDGSPRGQSSGHRAPWPRPWRARHEGGGGLRVRGP